MEFNPFKKKETTKIGAATLSIALAIFSACEKQDKKDSISNLNDKPTISKNIKEISSEPPQFFSIEIKKEDFYKLVDYVNTKGVLHNKEGVSLKQLTVTINNNRHNYIYRNDSPLVRDVVFTKDDYLVYVIDKFSIHPHVDEDGKFKRNKEAEEEIKDFLKKINP